MSEKQDVLGGVAYEREQEMFKRDQSFEDFKCDGPFLPGKFKHGDVELSGLYFATSGGVFFVPTAQPGGQEVHRIGPLDENGQVIS